MTSDLNNLFIVIILLGCFINIGCILLEYVYHKEEIDEENKYLKEKNVIKYYIFIHILLFCFIISSWFGVIYSYVNYKKDQRFNIF